MKEALFTGVVVSFVCPQLIGSCVQVFEDNQGAMALAANPLSAARSKHVDVRMCYLGGFCPVSWLVFNVFSVRQRCEGPGRVFDWIVPAMTVSCSRGLLKYSQAF